jgi:hypothetical protein
MQAWRVAGFTELRELGAGAQGRVVLARHNASGGMYAIKYVFSPGPAFHDEVRLLGQVTGPYVARLFDFLEEPGRGAAMIMEAVPGVSLRDVLAEHGALEPETSLAILKGSLLGLAAAHTVRIVHRDYKPANVLVPGDGPSKLIDFGIAVPAGAASRSGTPAYMAPEQWHGGPATPATDVYAATCVFFECVTGHRPYPGGETTALMAQHTSAPIPAEQAPEAVRSSVAHGMAKNPADRPIGATEFVTELEQAAVTAYGPDWEARGWRRLAEVAGVLLVASPIVAALLQGGASATSSLITGTASTTGAAGTGSAVAVKVAIGAAVLVAAAGTGAVVVPQASSGKPHPLATGSRSPSPTPTAVTVAAVTTCKDANGGSLGTGRAAGTVPATVQLPKLVKVPPGAGVGGEGFDKNGAPAYLIGPDPISCGYSVGADGGTVMTVGPDAAHQVVGMYNAGGVGVIESESCAVFGDVVPTLKSKLQTKQPCNADPTRTQGRQVLQTGVASFDLALMKEHPTPTPPSPYISVSLQLLHTDPSPQIQAVTCTMPADQAATCTAALTYFLIQSTTPTPMPQTTLSTLAQNIATFVTTTHA